VSLAERIQSLRLTRLVMTQEELGEKLGVGPVTVSRWERGIVEPRPRHLREMADLADLPVAWFFTDEVAA
jgi:transcriptional regulator with XRE-family HTH domain